MCEIASPLTNNFSLPSIWNHTTEWITCRQHENTCKRYRETANVTLSRCSTTDDKWLRSVSVERKDRNCDHVFVHWILSIIREIWRLKDKQRPGLLSSWILTWNWKYRYVCSSCAVCVFLKSYQLKIFHWLKFPHLPCLFLFRFVFVH